MKDLPIRLSGQALALYEDMVSGRVLGAANHIRMMGDILHLVATDRTSGQDDKKKDVLSLVQYFQRTRGQSSYAIVTALNLMTRHVHDDESSVASALRRGIDAYAAQAGEHASLISKYSARLAEDVQRFIVFDYSSTVEAFVESLSRPRTIYVPESRIIDGGRPFLSTFVAGGHDVHFIPDAAMLTVLDSCEAAFIGAETFYPDGTAFNTAGSDILAELCAARNIPFYVLTPLIKLDMRAAHGQFKQKIEGDMTDVLAASMEQTLKSRLNLICTELVAIPPRHIAAYVTEKGIIPPAALFGISLEYDRLVNAATGRSGQ